MEKNRLDEFFNKKLQGRSFEPTEEFWSQAEAMIEAQEEGRRKRRFLWWFLGLLLLVGIGVCWKMTSNTVPKELTHTTDPSEINTTTNTISKEKKSTEDATNEEIASTITNSSSEEESSKQSINTINSNQSTASRNQENQRATNNQQHADSKPDDTNAITNRKSPRIINNEADQSNLSDQTQQASENANSPASDTPRPDVSKQQTADETEIVTNQLENAAQGNAAKEQVFKYENILLKNLDDLLEAPDDFPELAAPKPYTSDYPKPRRRAFNIGVQAGAALFPGKVDDKYFNGWEAGITAQYQFHKNWLVGADLLYVHHRDTSGQIRIDTSSQFEPSQDIEYGFGRQVTTYAHVGSSMHTLELPIYLQYKVARHRLEAGLSFNYLLGFRGALESNRTLFPWERINQEGPRSSTSLGNKTWIDKDGFQKFYTAAVLGYRYRFNEHFDLGIRARYVWLKYDDQFNVASEERAIRYQEFRPINLRLSLRYYFIK